jgi:hypothetical protein
MTQTVSKPTFNESLAAMTDSKVGGSAAVADKFQATKIKQATGIQACQVGVSR